MKVVILEKEQSVAEILRFSLDSVMKSDCVFVKDSDQALQEVKSGNYDLIVADYLLSRTGGDLLKNLKESGELVPFIVTSSQDLENKEEFEYDEFLKFVRKPHLFDGIRLAVESFKETYSSESEAAVQTNHSYIPVSLNLLLTAKNMQCEIYLKVGEKLLKMLNTGSVFDQSEFDKYSSKNVKFLYLKSEDSRTFIESFQKLITDIASDESMSSEDKVMSIQDVIHESVRSFGISEEVVSQAAQTVNSIKDKIDKDKQFKSVIGSVFDGGKSYLTQHSIALMYVGIAIVKKYSGYNQEMSNKIATAALIHDVTLDHTSTQEYKIHLSDNPSDNFLNHPDQSAKLVEKMKNIAPDVDKMIQEHHEMPDGTGFPRGIKATQFTLLSAFFNFSHLVVEEIYKMKKGDEPLEMENLKKHLPLDKYDSGHFKKVVEAFEKSELF